ncbi:MAG TPA: NlpC/P60 family protein [Trebonia sp.]|nr:NlpC/P60 family protein [Trebonia sp.]
MHLTGGSVPRLARAIRRSGWRKALPAVVAATAVLGVVTGVTVTVVGGSSRAPDEAALGSGRAGGPVTPGPTATSVATLPPVTPVTGKAAASYLPDMAFTVDSRTAVPAVQAAGAPVVAPLKRTLTADLIVVSPSSLPKSVLTAVSGLSDVTAAEPVEAVRMRINGTYTAVLGVDPSGFRSFAAKPTAASDALWRGVAAGGIAVSYTMGELDKLPLGKTVSVAGRSTAGLRVVAFGTLGIGGVNAVVSHQVARSLGAPADNALVISLRDTNINGAASAITKLLPKGAAVQHLVNVVTTGGSASGTAGAGSSSASGASSSAINVMLATAMSERGKPYVWGGDGPDVFDCSGLVQWSFRQAGITMPRVAADQALTGPSVPVSQLQPGDLLFYHTDSTAPNYISHVAIYLGHGWMIQAPQPGEDVEVVPAAFGSEFAGAVRVNPAQAAAVASQVA